ncbi:MAG: sigma-70 family RNA polymerase sigma factor [Clostridia bacterium]|nr:sigma-70 family RNA polymerase sigma factor [Clostridia bacterium]
MEITEENIVKQLKTKDPRALEYVMSNYGKKVYALVYNVLKGVGSNEDIEECVSETFVQVWNRADEYSEERGSFKTWILILAKFKALDFRRAKLKIKAFSTEDMEIPSKESVESKVLDIEERRQIIEAINHLNETDKQIFYKRYFFYESIESIAKQFKMTREAVDNRLWRGRKRLKEALLRYREEEIV